MPPPVQTIPLFMQAVAEDARALLDDFGVLATYTSVGGALTGGAVKVRISPEEAMTGPHGGGAGVSGVPGGGGPAHDRRRRAWRLIALAPLPDAVIAAGVGVIDQAIVSLRSGDTLLVPGWAVESPELSERLLIVGEVMDKTGGKWNAVVA